jgi:signal transduction histidine kinase/CheY-like chemotaxis protein
LIYFPSALPWSRELQALIGSLAMAFVLGYCRILLQVRRLPMLFGGLFNVILICHVGAYLWMVLIDPFQGRMAIQLVFKLFYLALPLTLAFGLLRGLSYSWLAWVVVGAYSLQFLVRYVWQLDQVPLQSRESAYSLASTLPGVSLLICTLVMEFGRSRRREKRAVADLDRQQKTETERLESTVTLRTEQLRESLQGRSALLARIGHDLRSPLGSIIDYARMLRSGIGGIDYPRNIERNARHQLALIDELLEFSRGELQQMELLVVPGYLYGFLEEVAEEGEFLSSRRGNQWHRNLGENLPVLVSADFRRLRQVLMNLLGNAAKFTQDGRIDFDVERMQHAEEGRARLCFSITDTGIGIPADEREALLQPYRRGRNAERYEGSGLGLAIVNQLLAAMDSRLQIESPAQGGSRMQFVLDLEIAHEEQLDGPLLETTADHIEGGGRCILVVDDIPMNREWLCDLLGGYGFDPVAAIGGQEALEYLQRHSVDLLLTDQGMPGMDGWALLDAVRQRRPALPVVLYSAAPPRRPAGLPFDLNFDAMLLKPVDAAELLRCIDELAPRDCCADEAAVSSYEIEPKSDE